jgi:hypothetical protein
VGLKVQVLEVTSINLVVNVLGELGLVALLVVVGKTLHVLSDVTGSDVLAESLGIELLGLNVVTGETVLGVRDEETTVGGTLQGTEDTGTGGGTDKTDIEEDLEGAAGTLVGLSSLGQGVFTVSLLNTLEGVVELELLEETASEKETSGVGSGPVGQTVLDSIALQFVGVSGGDNLVTGDFGVDNLGDDVAVGEADLQMLETISCMSSELPTYDKTVLASRVLVLGLGDQALTGVVVGLSLTTTAVLGLVATERKSVTSN